MVLLEDSHLGSKKTYDYSSKQLSKAEIEQLQTSLISLGINAFFRLQAENPHQTVNKMIFMQFRTINCIEMMRHKFEYVGTITTMKLNVTEEYHQIHVLLT